MKKNYLKKSLSLVVTVLMLMSCWVFMPGEHQIEAQAALAYGMSAVNGASKQNATFKDHRTDSTGDYVQIKYPSIMYMDISENLADTGYSVNISTSFGSGSNYKLVVLPSLWGGQEFNEGGNGTCGTAVYKGQTTMIDNFNDFGLINGDLPGYYDNYSVDSSGNISLTCSNPGNEIGTGGFNAQFSGTAKAVGTYSYNMQKANGTPMTAIYIKTGSGSYTKNSWANDSADTGTPTNYQIVVYDKSGLNSAINTANGYLSQTSKYTADSLSNLRTAVNNGSTILKKREVLEADIISATNAINTAISTLVEARNFDVTYENLFSFADWYYSDSSRRGDTNVVSDLTAGKITINNPTTDASTEYTTHSNLGAHTATAYKIDVKGGTTYKFSWNISGGATSTEVFFMWKDASGASITGLNEAGTTYVQYPSASFTGDGHHTTEFIAPNGAAMVELRFDNNTDGTKVTFSDIAVYPKDRDTAVEVDSWTVRPTKKSLAYGSNLSAATLDVPVRNGYKFNGWYLDNINVNGKMDSGEAVTDGTGKVIRTDLTMLQTYNLYSDWLPLPMDIGYDNLFSLAEFVKTGSTKLSAAGNLTYDVMAGTITVESTGTGETYTTYNADGYTMTVKPNTEYVFSAKMTTPAESSQKYGQMFIFCYDANGNSVMGPTEIKADGSESTYSGQQHIGIYPSTDGVSTIKFRTPAECKKLRIRVGATASGVIETYSDIAVYEKATYDAYAKDYAAVRVPFNFGDTTQLSLVPVRAGYKFEGWFKADGTQLTSVDGLKASDTVYAKWVKMFTVTFKNWNGDVIKTQEVAPGANATAPANPVKDPDTNTEYVFDKWDTAFTNVQSDLTVTAVFKTKDHSLVKSYVSGSNCTEAAKYTQYCTSCNFTWNGVLEDAAMPALGHTYDRADPTFTVITGTSTGGKDTDLHTIKCNECDATKTVVHNFQLDAAHPATSATCIVAGETYYKCACLETKTEVGSVNPDNHVNTKIINAKDAACEVEGYTGDTYCNDCKKTVATGKATDALDHVYTTYTSNGDATCFADGTESALCDLCKDDTKKDTRTEVGSQLTHKYTNYVYNEGTAKCEVNGTETASCDHGCGTEDTREAANSALKHDYTGAYKNNENGTHSFLCKNGCGNYGATVDCVYGAWTTDNATTHSHTCTTCGYTPAAEAHDWSAWTTVGGSGTEKATQTRSCNVCGKVENTECNYVVEDHKDATCEAAELTTYKCSDCGHGYTVIGEGPKGHNFNGTAKNNNNGTHSFACANGCGEYGFGTTKNASVACSDWTYANTEAGKHTATCKTCGYVKTENCSGGEATCTAQAVCQFCNTAYGNKAAHNITGTEKYLKKATDATCIANETYYKYCINCENEFSTETYEKPDTMTDHDYTCTDEYLYIATQAKCGVNETYYAYCSNADCKKSSEDANNTYEKAGTALTHKWGNAVNNNNGTHTEKCLNSNTDNWTCTETRNVNCVEWKKQAGVASATCTEQGYTLYECEVCAYTWKDNYTDALGHDYTQKVYDEAHLKAVANCEHANIYYYDCLRCDKNAKDETDTDKYTTLTYLNGEVRKHSFQNKVADEYLANPATCFAAAKYYTSCKYEDCGKSSEEVYGEGKGVKFSSGSALTHVFDKKVETYLATEADCVNNATYYYVCSLCDTKGTTTWEKENSKSGHALTHTDAVPADCEKAGNYEYWHCATCNKYFKDKDATEVYANQAATVIAKLGHDIVNVGYKAATCEVDGNPAYVYCTRCSHTTYPAVLPDGYKATGHNFTSTTYYCDTANNYHAKFCANANCDMITLTDAEGNPYQVKTFGMVINGEQVKYTVEYDGLDYVISGGEKCEFTYKAETKNGVHSHANACVCGNNTTKTYSYDETFVETVAPTCTTEGYDSYACPDCGATWKTNVLPAKEHVKAEAPTSNGDGTHSYYCTVVGCGAKITTENCSGGTATCSNKAVCSVCEGEYGEATGNHVLDETAWTQKDPADCYNAEVLAQTCSACKMEVTKEGEPATGHSMTEYGFDTTAWNYKPDDFDDALVFEPTCKDEGKSISYCVNCDKYVLKPEGQDKGNHVWETDADGKEIWTLVSGSCSTGYTYICKCKNGCGSVKTKIEDGVHEWAADTIVRDVCDKYDYIVFKCTKCGDFTTFDATTTDFEITDKDGNVIDIVATYGLSTEKGEHSWSAYKVTKEATCAVTGRQERTCAKCDKVEKEDIPVIAGAHDRANYGKEGNNLKKVAATKATCTMPGHHEDTDEVVYYYECTRCSYSENANGKYTQPALDHKDNDGDGICDGCKESIKADGCICHKDSGFMKFIYKILKFFWKLFKINPVCACGAKHY